MKLDGEWIPADMSLELPGDCVLREFEYAFWAAPDAPLLFFSAKERDASCKVLPGELFDVFVVKLNEAGLPEGAPAPAGVSQAGKSDVEPEPIAGFVLALLRIGARHARQVAAIPRPPRGVKRAPLSPCDAAKGAPPCCHAPLSRSCRRAARSVGASRSVQ
jgi:hypothetical protein